MVNQNNSISQGYSHIYKYNPDGRGYGDAKTTLTMLQLNHFINSKMFYDLKFSRTHNDYGSYLYEDYDSYEIISEDGIYRGEYFFAGDTLYNYVNDKYMTAYGQDGLQNITGMDTKIKPGRTPKTKPDGL